MTVLLESNALGVESEDAVLAAALAWAEASSQGAQGHLELLARVVLPRIRAPFLSPKAVLHLSRTLLGLLRGTPRAHHAEQAAGCSGAASPLESPLSPGLPSVYLPQDPQGCQENAGGLWCPAPTWLTAWSS